MTDWPTCLARKVGLLVGSSSPPRPDPRGGRGIRAKRVWATRGPQACSRNSRASGSVGRVRHRAPCFGETALLRADRIRRWRAEDGAGCAAGEMREATELAHRTCFYLGARTSFRCADDYLIGISPEHVDELEAGFFE